MATPDKDMILKNKDQLGDFTTDSRTLLVAAMAAAVATLSVGTAWLLLQLIYLMTNLAYHGQFSTANMPIAPNGSLPAISVIIPVIGCLAVGLMARYGSEKIRGHGIPEAIEAILIGKSQIQPKVAILKPISSAISIGTGGPFGAEGPIIMTGGALGSLFAQSFKMSSVERKVLLVAGAAAGMTAIFGTPIAAVVLAVELLLFEWKPRSFIPVAVAAIVAAIERPLLFGDGPLFPFAGDMHSSAIACLAWVAVGIASGLGSGLLTLFLYAVEDIFQKLPIHWMWWPAIGGVAIGLGGLVEPQALGIGYESIRHLLNGSLVGHEALLLLVVKTLIWGIALGSGTSGGILAPLLIMGGALGALGSPFLPQASPGFWPLLGMAAMMGGTMRSPLTATFFAVEITGATNIMVPLLTACVASHAVTVLLLRRSILTEKIARRGLHLSREYHVDPFEMTRIADVMSKDVDTLPATMSLGETVAFFSAPGPRHETYPVVEKGQKAIGVVSYAEALRWTRNGYDHAMKLASATVGQELMFCSPEDMVGAVADRMIERNRGRALVIDATGALVGVVGRQDLWRARSKMRSDEEDYSRVLFWGWRKTVPAGEKIGD